MTYVLDTDCESAGPEESCGEVIELMTNGYGGYLPGGDVIEGTVWRYTAPETIEVRLEDNDEVIKELVVVGSELHQTGTDRVFVPTSAEVEADGDGDAVVPFED